MTSEEEQVEVDEVDIDPKIVEVLDQYLEFLHAGNAQACEELLEQNPELENDLECLHVLDSLAAPKMEETVYRNRLDSAAGQTPVFSISEDSASGLQQAAFPREFGDYELQGILGRGGMGIVFEARQKNLDRTVALKMIRANHLASEEEIRRFYAEAKATARFSHPHIVGVHDVGQVNGQHYYTMDYVAGETLVQSFLHGAWEAKDAAQCLAIVARAVDSLHQQNIVHRDLKPANILIDESGKPYVTDFGLAKIFDVPGPETQTGAILGTPSYMSPEQAAGKVSEISALSDVYSLGAILYEMLTGRPPYQESNPLDTLVQVLEGEPTLPAKLNPSLSRELELICLKCLEKEPERRYQSAVELADDLESYLRGDPIQAKPSGVAHQCARWARREPALAAHLLGFMAIFLIIQANYFLNSVDFYYHCQILSVIGLWAMVSLIFQRLLNWEPTENFAKFAWSASDAVMLTSLLYLTDGPLGPLLIGYPLLVTASGMFFRVRLVWFMTIVCLISYAALIVLVPTEADPPHYPLIFAAVLSVVGFVVAYQVYRVRVLSRYFESQKR